MKTINKPIWHLLLYLFILSLAGSCSDEDMRRKSIGSSLKENGDHSVSSFTLPQENSEIINKDGIIYLQLTSLSDNSTLDFEGNLRFLSGNLTHLRNLYPEQSRNRRRGLYNVDTERNGRKFIPSRLSPYVPRANGKRCTCHCT